MTDAQWQVMLGMFRDDKHVSIRMDSDEDGTRADMAKIRSVSIDDNDICVSFRIPREKDL